MIANARSVEWQATRARQTAAMDDLRFGSAIRAARQNRHWRQADLAAASGVSRGTVGRIERGRLDELSLGTLRRVAQVLEIRVGLVPKSRGAELERVLSRRHSALAEAVTRWIGALPGWAVRPEVSFSIWGERGVVDLLAWHEATRSLLVIELKTAIVDVGELLGTLDRKVRLAHAIVADLDWKPVCVSVALVVGESMTNRRRVGAHRATLGASLPQDGRQLRGWLAAPTGVVRALAFVSDTRPGSTRSGFATPLAVSSRSRRGRPGNGGPPEHGRRAPDR